MKLVSKKFWRLVSLVPMLSVAIPAALGLANSKRANELALAGLRPGHDKIVAPQKTFRELDRDESATDALLWGDVCTHRELRVELDANKVVQTVTVDNNYKPEIMAKCRPDCDGSQPTEAARDRPRLTTWRFMRSRSGNLRQAGIGESFRERKRTARIIVVLI